MNTLCNSFGCDFNCLRKNPVTTINLGQVAKGREESTPTVAIWKRPVSPDLCGIGMARDTRERSAGKFRGSVLQTFHHATQFGEPLQAADIGVAGVGFLVDVAGEQVSMIGPHGNFVIPSLGAPPA